VNRRGMESRDAARVVVPAGDAVDQ